MRVILKNLKNRRHRRDFASDFFNTFGYKPEFQPMKKITLALSAAVLLGLGAQAQSTYELVAPPDMNGTSSFRAPNGTSAHKLHRALFFVHSYEMLPMNLATINS